MAIEMAAQIQRYIVLAAADVSAERKRAFVGVAVVCQASGHPGEVGAVAHPLAAHRGLPGALLHGPQVGHVLARELLQHVVVRRVTAFPECICGSIERHRVCSQVTSTRFLIYLFIISITGNAPRKPFEGALETSSNVRV